MNADSVPSAEPKVQPTARVDQSRWAGSAVWLLPLAALGLAGYLGYRFLAGRGPMITITFKTAAGLSEQQTEVRYKSVALGTVEEVSLSDDLSHVVAQVRMNARAEQLLTDEARFWVVRPRVGGGLSAVRSGLETLVSGAYVAMDPGRERGAPRRHFEGLEDPPSVRSAEPGTVYFLEADSLGGVHSGAPVSYRDIVVGDVLSYELRPEASVKIRIFVRAPYDSHVVRGTRFWNTSGISVESGARGLELKLESARALLSGGIAFHSPPTSEQVAQSPPQTTFQLYPNQAVADVGLFGESSEYVSYFEGSVYGLAEGSEVSLLGKPIGAVTAVELTPDPRPGRGRRMAARVQFVIQPGRATAFGKAAALSRDDIRELVEHQLRVVLTTKNLLTSEKMLSLEYVPGSDDAKPSSEGEALVLPSETQNIEQVSQRMAHVAAQIDQIPFAQIGASLQRVLASVEHSVKGPELRRSIVSLEATLSELEQLAQTANQDLSPALARMPAIARELEGLSTQANAALGDYNGDSSVRRNLTHTLTEVADAARSLRLLADYLNRHPEALLRGRKQGAP